MKLLRSTLLLISSLTYTLAFKVRDSKVIFPEDDTKRDNIFIGDIDVSSTEQVQEIIVEDIGKKIGFKFLLDLSGRDIPKVPGQLSLLTGLPERNLEVPLNPVLSDTDEDNSSMKQVLFNLDLTSLPGAILHYATKFSEPITLSLIVADSESNGSNIFKPIANVQLQDANFADKFVEPERYGVKPEISFTFPDDPKTVNPVIAQVFALIVLACAVLTLLLWAGYGAISLEGLSQLNIVYFLGFMGALVGMEYIFFAYYLGVSIFDTIYAATIVGSVGLVVGSMFLRTMRQKI